MAKDNLGKVRDVAKRIVNISSSYYSEELLGLIPGELLDRTLTDENLHGTSIEIDQLRFEKQYELLRLRGIATPPDAEISNMSGRNWETSSTTRKGLVNFLPNSHKR